MGCGASAARNPAQLVADPPVQPRSPQPERSFHTPTPEQARSPQAERAFAQRPPGTPTGSICANVDIALPTRQAPETQTAIAEELASPANRNSCSGIEVAMESVGETEETPDRPPLRGLDQVGSDLSRKGGTYSLRRNTSRPGSRPQSRGHSRPVTAESVASDISCASSARLSEHGGEDDAPPTSPRADSYVVVRDAYGERLVGRDAVQQTPSNGGHMGGHSRVGGVSSRPQTPQQSNGTPQPLFSAASLSTPPAARPSGGGMGSCSTSSSSGGLGGGHAMSRSASASLVAGEPEAAAAAPHSQQASRPITPAAPPAAARPQTPLSAALPRLECHLALREATASSLCLGLVAQAADGSGTPPPQESVLFQLQMADQPLPEPPPDAEPGAGLQGVGLQGSGLQGLQPAGPVIPHSHPSKLQALTPRFKVRPRPRPSSSRARARCAAHAPLCRARWPSQSPPPSPAAPLPFIAPPLRSSLLRSIARALTAPPSHGCAGPVLWAQAELRRDLAQARTLLSLPAARAARGRGRQAAREAGGRVE